MYWKSLNHKPHLWVVFCRPDPCNIRNCADRKEIENSTRELNKNSSIYYMQSKLPILAKVVCQNLIKNLQELKAVKFPFNLSSFFELNLQFSGTLFPSINVMKFSDGCDFSQIRCKLFCLIATSGFRTYCQTMIFTSPKSIEYKGYEKPIYTSEPDFMILVHYNIPNAQPVQFMAKSSRCL